jgi:hypothetical protein
MRQQLDTSLKRGTRNKGGTSSLPFPSLEALAPSNAPPFWHVLGAGHSHVGIRPQLTCSRVRGTRFKESAGAFLGARHSHQGMRKQFTISLARGTRTRECASSSPVPWCEALAPRTAPSVNQFHCARHSHQGKRHQLTNSTVRGTRTMERAISLPSGIRAKECASK